MASSVVKGTDMFIPEALTHEGHRTVLRHLHEVQEEAEGLSEPGRLRRELTEYGLVHARVCRHERDVGATSAEVIFLLGGAGDTPAFDRGHPLYELPGLLDVFCAARDGEGESAAPGDEAWLALETSFALESFSGDRSGSDSEIEIGSESGYAVEEPVAIYLHGDEVGEERIELICLETRREGIDGFDAFERVVDRDHILQGLDGIGVIHGAGTPVGAHELATILPAIQVEPRVAKVGDEAYALEAAVAAVDGELFRVEEQLIPGARGLIGIEASFAKELSVVVQGAVIGIVGNGVDFTLVRCLCPAGVIEVLFSDTVGFVAITSDEVVEWAEGIAGGPIADSESVLMDDIGRDLADDGGHELLGVHAASAHGKHFHINIRMTALELGYGGVEAFGILRRLKPPYDELYLLRGASAATGEESGRDEAQDEHDIERLTKAAHRISR